ncbi:DUF2071 domain-containing protein [Lacihabitans sp. LS3-19]|uniref:YqjF family protein n=1 Tax=Lacihabitans sp. LS3-19 TaxID=2487335 RepID=UPI0020CF043F|nr:DUF2071 domain-containing protein [Lacihabitans sp. LS3-19]MCP9768542.1 DUF2071 domain-containing protein [Lacihabitans sp. LS3-19]
MTINEILNSTEHRNWVKPKESWRFYQEWNEAVFFHWKVEVDILQKYIPNGLEIDLFEGQAWVSLVVFKMEKIRPKGFPAFSPISNFDEINIRTYVKSGNKTGVYFLSIEASSRISCFIARKISELPYRFSNIKRSFGKIHSVNNTFEESLKIEYQLSENVNEKSDLDKWLTERYALFQDADLKINSFDIHHLEWPLKAIEVSYFKLNYNRFENLIGNTPDKIQYSKGVKVLAWGKKQLNV